MIVQLFHIVCFFFSLKVIFESRSMYDSHKISSRLDVARGSDTRILGHWTNLIRNLRTRNLQSHFMTQIDCTKSALTWISPTTNCLLLDTFFFQDYASYIHQMLVKDHNKLIISFFTSWRMLQHHWTILRQRKRYALILLCVSKIQTTVFAFS